MPVPQVNIRNGSIVNPPAALQFGQPFQWANPVVGVNVGITNCGGFCAQSSYPVPGAPSAGSYGLADAVLLQNPTNYSFSENPNQWNAPGMPHITNPPWPTPKNNEEKKEVA